MTTTARHNGQAHDRLTREQEALRHDQGSLLDALAGTGADASNPKAIQCPIHKGRHKSSGVYQDDAGVFRFQCHSPKCEFGGDVFDVRAWLHRRPVGDELAAVVRPDTNGKAHGTNGKAQAGNGRTYHATRDRAIEAACWGKAKVHGKLAGTWDYHDGAGELVASVLRFDLPTPEGEKQGKLFTPVSRHPAGWCNADPPSVWPLYRLSKLLARPGERVFIVEGERCADVLAAIGLLVTTSAHGAKSAGKSDWAPLVGRDVVIVPDHDGPGADYAHAVAGILAKLAKVEG